MKTSHFFTPIMYALIFTCWATHFSLAQGKGMEFHHGTWSEAMADAKKQQKIIFVDGYTSWCGPCKWMAKNTFPNDTVGDFYNSQFINYKLDMEKGEGVAFAKQYEVKAYPTLLYIDGDGNLLHKGVGARGVNEFVELGKDALDPGKQLFSLKKRYGTGDKSPEFLRQYANALADAYEPSYNVASEYLKTLSREDWLKKENMEFLFVHVDDLASPEFVFLLANKDKFVKEMGAKQVDNKISYTAMRSIRQAAINKKESLFNTTLETLKKHLPQSEELVAEATMNYHKYAGDWIKYSYAAAEFTEKYAMNDANQLNNIAWDFYEHVEDLVMLGKAEKWAAKAAELQENYANMDTYGAVLYKIGKKEEAIKKLEKAIELAKKAGNTDYAETEALLNKAKDSGKRAQ